MERRNALALAGSLAICVTAAGTAMAANIGLLQSAGAPGQVGQLTVQKVAAVAPPRPTTTEGPAPSAAEVEAEEAVAPTELAPEAAPGIPEATAEDPPPASSDPVSPEPAEVVWSESPSPEVWSEPAPPATPRPAVSSREEVEHESTPVTTAPRSTTTEKPEHEDEHEEEEQDD